MKSLTNCPACGAAGNLRRWYEFRDDHGSWSMERCASCNHGMVNPQPSWAELAPYYPENYAPYAPNHEPSAGLEEEVLAQARHEGLLRHTPFKAGDRLLDFGCGGGNFVRWMCELGVRAAGVDPSENAVRASSSQGLEVIRGGMEEVLAHFGPACFDTITANHVLEHVPDPLTTLEQMHEALRPGGRVVIAVPNAAYWACRLLRNRWHSTDAPRHMHQFTTDSIMATASRSEFDIERVQTYSLPKGVAGSIRQFMRRFVFVPMRLSQRVRFIDRISVGWLGPALDRRKAGEAIIVWMRRTDG